MDSLLFLASIIVLFLFLGAVLGWVSFFKIQKLNEKIQRLEKAVARLKMAPNTEGDESLEELAEELAPEPRVIKRVVRKRRSVEEEATTETQPSPPVVPPVEQKSESDSSEEVEEKPDWFDNLRENWMIWLGGICVGLAGIFLVRYSMDAGLLGPTQRIIGAFGLGIGLHALAQWLRIKNSGSHPAFAALAGGASITLYAATLAALHLYQLFSSGLAFSLLTIISLFTMMLALRDGPILAIIGILGAYVVPVLVSDNSGNILGAMVYGLIITGAALFLLRYVYRSWLWYGMLTGALGWWAVSLTTAGADAFRGLYLTLLTYGILAIPSFDWLLRKSDEDSEPEWNPQSGLLSFLHPVRVGVFLSVMALTCTIMIESFTADGFICWAPFYLVILIAGRAKNSVLPLGWISLVAGWFAWLCCGLDFDGDVLRLAGFGQDMQKDFLIFSVGMALVYSGGSWFAARGKEFNHVRYSLISLAPVVWFALAYLLVTDLSVRWEWSLGGALLAALYIGYANYRERMQPGCGEGMWLILAGHFSFSLAAAMFLREASLTLVLAVQIISLVYVMNMYSMDGLKWLVKGVLALVVVRLTLNPWLLQYPADMHWSLWTYGGAVLCCICGCLLLKADQPLRKWLEAATLHLFVLFLAAETRYWLYDGNIFIEEYTLTEASINTMLWSALGLVYYYRARTSDYLETYYTSCSRILLCLAVFNYGLVLTVLNPLWSYGVVGQIPLFNMLLPAYGGPLFMAVLCTFFYEKRYQKYAVMMCGVTLMVFVNMEIRHLWQRAMFIDLPISGGELYTYSIVWLVMAVAAILAGARLEQAKINKAGMGLLLVVIAKIFLIDMSDLEGLLRVASFMGLGLSLLGLAFLYQKIIRKG